MSIELRTATPQKTMLQLLSTQSGKFFAEAASSDEDESVMMVDTSTSSENRLVLFSGETDSSSNSAVEEQPNNKKARLSASNSAESVETFSQIDKLLQEIVISFLKSQLKDMSSIIKLETQVAINRKHLKENTLPNDLTFKPLKHQYLKSIPNTDTHRQAEQTLLVELQKKVLEYRLSVYLTQFDISKNEFIHKYSEENMTVEYNKALTQYFTNADLDQAHLAYVAQTSLTSFMAASKASLEKYMEKVQKTKLKKAAKQQKHAQINKDKVTKPADDNVSVASEKSNSSTRTNNTVTSAKSTASSKAKTSQQQIDDLRVSIEKLANIVSGKYSAPSDSTPAVISGSTNSRPSNKKNKKNNKSNNSSTNNDKSTKNDETPGQNNNSHQTRSRSNSVTSNLPPAPLQQHQQPANMSHSTQSSLYNQYHHMSPHHHNYDNWYNHNYSYYPPPPPPLWYAPGARGPNPTPRPHFTPRVHDPNRGGGRKGLGPDTDQGK